VPSSRLGRSPSEELFRLADRDLMKAWCEHDQETSSFEVRGWYREKYRQEVIGNSIVDLGCGFSVDGIYFCEAGARVTFVDIVASNLRLVERVATLRGIVSRCRFVLLDDPLKPVLPEEVDLIFAIGSLHHIPFAWARQEVAALARFVRPGGKFCLFTYPLKRFFESGALDFSEFGKKTDGEATPWAEWYDHHKIRHLFDGLDFSLTYERLFGRNNDEFIWHEMTQKT